MVKWSYMVQHVKDYNNYTNSKIVMYFIKKNIKSKYFKHTIDYKILHTTVNQLIIKHITPSAPLIAYRTYLLEYFYVL